jgi:hypothetical protein
VAVKPLAPVIVVVSPKPVPKMLSPLSVGLT